MLCDNAGYHSSKLRELKKLAVLIRGVKLVNVIRESKQNSSVDESKAS
ncbi:hypothetical protein ACKOUE_14670 [Legionella pneumophila]|nr:hypothetical protein [Legionella pneumophila]HAT1912079.1 hypothetical protein [Legionella pneumophila]HAT1915074.1 hypothetical protein [Legionella pneumophila]HAT1930669.1 hypothetical protein [Legionella pneumophila]HAT2022914.1 hypothetical protein [Legionella pneumophila]